MTAVRSHSSRLERRSAGSRRTIRVLLVEDDADSRSMLTVTMKAEGYDVTAVASADEALAALRGRRHDVILTDYWMPRKDGLQFLEEAQSLGVIAKAPVIVCSAYPPSPAPGITIVEKPVALDDLMRRIRSMVRRRAPH